MAHFAKSTIGEYCLKMRSCLIIALVIVVHVMMASAGNAQLSATGDQIWHQDVRGIQNRAQEGDNFGRALAYGDFNGDGYTDLAIGVPSEAIGTIGYAGAVNVIYGSAAGLRARRDQIWHQNVDGIQNQAQEGDNFGWALASGDFNDDGYADLAIGVPNEAIGRISGAGAVNVIYGSAAGLRARRDQIWHQNRPGIEGGAEERDAFGTALASGDFNNDGYADLAIGVPNEAIGTVVNAGAVNVIYGSAAGLSATGDQIWHQNQAGIEGEAEARDYFGRALASGDFNNDGYADLAVGVPSEAIGTISGAGAVNVIYGSAAGLSATGDQIWHQNQAGIAGASETSDAFGAALASGDFNGDGRADLAIGVPWEDIGTIVNAGAVNVIYGSAAGLTATGDQLWHQNSSGVLGGAEEWDVFGTALASGDFNGDGRADLAIGVQNESIGSVTLAGGANVLYGSAAGLTATGDQFWNQNTSGVEGAVETGDYFGFALTSGDFNGDGDADLAIGVPWEDIGTISSAGAVNVLYGSH